MFSDAGVRQLYCTSEVAFGCISTADAASVSCGSGRGSSEMQRIAIHCPERLQNTLPIRVLKVCAVAVINVSVNSNTSATRSVCWLCASQSLLNQAATKHSKW